LFDNNTLVSSFGFNNAFDSCSNLASVPSELFRYNSVATGFRDTFRNCDKLVMPSDLFWDGVVVTKENRFDGQTVDFTRFFDIWSWSGASAGTAPELWNAAGTLTGTDAFSDHSLSSLTNWESVPEGWGGPPVSSSSSSVDSSSSSSSSSSSIDSSSSSSEGIPKNGMVYWFDADDSSTVIRSGTDVTQWNDRSGNGVNLPALNNPQYVEGAINSKGAVLLDGVDQEFELTTGSRNAGSSFIVCTRDSTMIGGYTGILTGDASAIFFINSNVQTTLFSAGRFGTNIWVDGVKTLTTPSDTTFVLSGVAAFAAAADGVVIGRDRSVAGRFWKGYMAEVITYDRVLSDAERETVQDYLAIKWGVVIENNSSSSSSS